MQLRGTGTLVVVQETTRRRERAAVAGHAGDEATLRLLLADTDAAVRATAYHGLARAGSLTAEDCRAALSDPSPAVRHRACRLAIPFDIDLVPLLTDEDDHVVEQAAWALGERGERAVDAVGPLSAVTTAHEAPLCREAAVAALGAIGHEDGLAAILHATQDKPAVRRRAVLALSPFGGPEVDAALERALVDRDWQVRQAAEDLTQADERAPDIQLDD